MSMRSWKFRRPRWRIVALILGGLILLSLMSGCAAVTVVPELGAQAADWLRGIIGDEAVAQLENFVFLVQDDIHQVTYSLGLGQSSNPFEGTPVAVAPTDSALPAPSATPVASPADASPTAAAANTPTPEPTLGSTQSPTPAATATATRAAWKMAPLKPLGNLPGEGQWLPYLENSAGQVVAYRTFLQPDHQRPYAVVAVVAFDLSATHLHFVLGSLEPTSPVQINRPGTIPPQDLLAGKLLATFNGGFKERHGNFGLLVDGILLNPPRDALGTVAFYTDGHIRVGQWGTDIVPSADMVTWRQNGPLVVQNGQVNPHTADTAPQDWGYTVPGSAAIWRSGIGMSADGSTLYYIAGPSLTLPALALSMQGANMEQAMQLDINNFWVHFDSIARNLQATPLLDKMNNNVGRYLSAYPRDFFYVTADGG